MKSARLTLAVAALLAGACSIERYEEGGFETSDLSARVLTPSGTPAVGARVWLVRTHGDSLPGTAVDSTWTDSSGLAKFTVSRTEDRSRLGLDGKLDAWLAIAQKPLLLSDSARLPLTQVQTVSMGASQTGELPKLFVPGSHFLSTTTLAGKAVLTIPRGTWTIARSFSTGTPHQGTTLIPLVHVDSLPVVFDTSSTQPDTASFFRYLDSLRIDGLTYYADSTFPLPITWARDTGLLDSCRLMPSLISDDTGILVLETKPAWIAHGVDTQNIQGGSEIASGVLPDSGTLAVQFMDPQAFLDDTLLLRTMRLTDSVGAGSMVRLGLPVDTMLTNQGPLTMPQSGGSSSTSSPMKATAWYFSWNPTRITVRADTALIGTVTTQLSFHRLRFRLAATSLRSGRSAIRLTGIRLYKP